MTLRVDHNPFLYHKPGLDCDVFQEHTHLADGSILVIGDIRMPSIMSKEEGRALTVDERIAQASERLAENTRHLAVAAQELHKAKNALSSAQDVYDLALSNQLDAHRALHLLVVDELNLIPNLPPEATPAQPWSPIR